MLTEHKIQEKNNYMIDEIKVLFNCGIPDDILQEKNVLRKNELIFDFYHKKYLEKLEEEKC